MKALYTNNQKVKLTKALTKDLKTWDYDSRWEALKQNFTYVHLFETSINDENKLTYQYYSTMKL
jgi:hypothetical protein